MSSIRNSVIPDDNVPIIAVLDDTQGRVDWLQKEFPDFHVAWSTNVVDFCASLETLGMSGRLALILLDHDLGFYHMDLVMGVHGEDHNFLEDKNGHTGMDACMAMTVYPNVPVLIWSGNQDATPNMEKVLKARGYLRVSRKPVDFYRDEVRRFIVNAIGS